LEYIYYSQTSGGTYSGKEVRRHRINDEIKIKEVRVIDVEGKALGIMKTSEAIKLAEERELDLVEIAPQAKPPVCKIIDYGKFVYELQKREKQQRKHQQQQMKEIRFKARTATHDFNFKTRHAREFINQGNKVKATVMFRGREISHVDIGKELLRRFVEELEDIAKVDTAIRNEGRNLIVIMAPDKTKRKTVKTTE
jgi:translation initiation factor IF-3